MRSSDDFKAEVYRRAEAKTAEIRRRKRAAAVIIPCIAVAVTAVALVMPTLDKTAQGEQTPPKDIAGQVDTTVMGEAENYPYDSVVIPGGSSDRDSNAMSDGTPAGSMPQKPSTGASANTGTLEAVIVKIPHKDKMPSVGAQLISTEAELKDYMVKNGLSEDFHSEAEQFNEKFFKDNVLIAAVVGRSDKSADYTILGVEKSEKIIVLKLNGSRVQNDDYMTFILCPVEKSVALDAETVNLDIRWKQMN